MSRRKPQLFLTLFLVLLIFGLGTRIVKAADEKEKLGQNRKRRHRKKKMKAAEAMC